MRILILGGTVFLGRHLVHAAQERGHTITLFNRGQRNPDLFPELERLTGDRDGGLDILDGRELAAIFSFPAMLVCRLSILMFATSRSGRFA